MTEIVGSNLPSTWKLVRLGDIAKTTSGGTPRRDRPQYYGGQIPWVKSGELGDSVVYETGETITDEALGSSSAKVFPKGTLCMALYGATVGKLGILGIDAATNQAVCAIFPPEGLDTRYLYRFFESKRREFIEQGKGGAQPNISQGIIRDTQIPVAPPDEQRRIVAEIEKQFTRLEAGVAGLRRVQANLKRYRAAVLKAACEGRLVATEAELAKAETRKAKFETGEALLARILTERRQTWQGRGKYKGPAAPDIANLPSLPDGWTWATPDQLSAFDEGAICAGPFGTIFKAHDFRPEGVPIIFLRHVAPGHYLTRKPGFMDVDKWEELFKPYSVFGGELLVTKLGEPPGVCAIYPEGIGPAMVTPDVIKMTPNASVALPQFLMHYFNSQTARDFATGVAFGTTRLRLTLPIFREMPVPLPPLAEQTRIVAEVERRLSVVEGSESVVTANLQRAARLRQSILERAFTGNLVPQNPSDESAETLLKRINDLPLEAKPAKRKTKSKDENLMSSKPITTLEELLQRLDSIGGAAAPDRLLAAAGLGEEVEKFFDLLREGRNNGALIVPTGTSGDIKRSSHEN